MGILNFCRERKGVIDMIVDRGRQNNIIVRYRDEDLKRASLVIRPTKYETSRYGINKGSMVRISSESIEPYCFVETQYHHHFNTKSKEHGFKGLYGEELTKLSVWDPQHVMDIKNRADDMDIKTWEANIPWINRVLSDRIMLGEKPFPNYKHKIWYLDCEWNPETKALRVITFHDSFLNTTFCLYVNPNYEGKSNTSNRTPGRRNAHWDFNRIEFPNEESMLREFLDIMEESDPDVITGWFVVGADIKTIIERLNVKGLRPQSLSPHNRIQYTFGDWQQPIPGRLCIDLMVAGCKLWELKNGKLPGYKLDDVAYEILGEKKVELPDGHNTYHTDLNLYLDYAIQDVELLPKIDSKVNAIEYYLALQHLVQCDIKSTPYITKMFTNLVLQDENFDRRIPTKAQFDFEEYEGADVMEVEAGLHQGVGILDVKAMYHSNADLHNISWETLVNDEEHKHTPKKDCGNGVRFRHDEKGLLVRQMDKMTDLRNHYKKLMVSDPDNKDRWDAMQYACKSLVASMYGVCGDSRYGMYHPKVADAITFTSRQTLKKLREVAAEVGWNTIYGHTDSIFVTGLDMSNIKAPTLNMRMRAEKGDMEKLRVINKEMAPIEVQFERYCDSMLLMAKNRYAGNSVWTDGKWHEPKLYIKGIEMKQSRMPPIMKEAMNKMIQGILGGERSELIEGELCSLIDSVMKGEEENVKLCMKGKLTKNIGEYKSLSGASAGAAWANERIGKRYRGGDFFLTTIGRDGKYMAFDNPSEIEGLYEIGYRHICERFIVNKIKPYCEIMGWPMQPYYNALDGKGGLSWL